MLWIALGWAQEAEPAEEPTIEEPAASEPPRSFEIPPLDTPLPSATRSRKELEALSSDPAELEALLAESGFEMDDFRVGSLVRGAWYIRPSFSVATLLRGQQGGTAARLGFAAGRRFWTLEALPIQLAADLGIRGTAPVGAANGRRLEAQAAIGPWLGPLRVQLSAGARWERERWAKKSLELVDAGFVTAGVGLGLDLQAVQLNLGLTPAFGIAGARPRATAGGPLLPVIGTETVYSVGLGLPIRPLGFALDGSWRDTVIGGVLEIGLSIQVAP